MMPPTLQAALLGVVQGLTEFLPVSSSAHLILARAFFGFDGEVFGLPFDVACHFGTLIAIIIYFHREIAQMVASLPRLFSVRRAEPGLTARGGPSQASLANARLIWLLVVGTVPAVVVGLLFKRAIEDYMRTPLVAGAALGIGAILLFLVERSGQKLRSDRTITMLEALWIGCAQAVALIPGVSRSGATITVAMFLGLRRADAARFIFLLAIPAILGAVVGEMPELLKAGVAGEAALIGIGVASSAVVGYATVKYFIRYLGNHSLDAFAWYRLGLALAVVLWVLGRRI